jgi:hypothetical protein
VVIETGNADSWAAKSLKEDWGYPAVCGHLQVLSPETLLNLDREAEIEPISLIKGRHASENFNHILYCGMLAYGFHFLKLAYSALKHFTGELYSLSKLLDRGPPAANLGDHMILIGRKV